MRYEAVLFDWMLTLADYPDDRQHLLRAHDLLGRTVDGDDLDSLIVRLREAALHEDVALAFQRGDCSATLHLTAAMLHFARAKIHAELAEAMYSLLGDPDFHPIYPEAKVVFSRSPSAAFVLELSATSTSTFASTLSVVESVSSSTNGSCRTSSESKNRTPRSFVSRSTSSGQRRVTRSWSATACHTTASLPRWESTR